MAIKLRDLTPGTCVYLDETVNNVKTRVPYIYLGLDYNKNCILLRQYAVEQRTMVNTVSGATATQYDLTEVCSWLENTENGFLSRFDDKLIKKINKTLCATYNISSSSGSGTLTRNPFRCFILSGFELGRSTSNNEGNYSVSYVDALKTFAGTTDAATALITYNESGNAVEAWTRTASTFGNYVTVNISGYLSNRPRTNNTPWIRPAISFRNVVHVTELGTNQYYIESIYSIETVGDMRPGTTIYIPERVSGIITSIPYWYLGMNDAEDHIFIRQYCLADKKCINDDYSTNYEDTEIDQWLEDTNEGFLSRFRESIISFLKDTVIQYSDTNRIREINRKCFLPSYSEMGYGDLPVGNEGSSFLQIFKEIRVTNLDTNARTTSADGAGTASYWLRSAANSQQYYAAGAATTPSTYYTNAIGNAYVRPMLSMSDLTPIDVIDDMFYLHSSISDYSPEEIEEGSGVFIPEITGQSATTNTSYIYIGKNSSGANLFLRATTDTTVTMSQNNICSYDNSTIDEWLNKSETGFISRFTPDILNALVNTSIKYVDYSKIDVVTGQVIEINRKCFLPSASELGFPDDPAGNDGVSILQSLRKYYNLSSATDANIRTCYVRRSSSGDKTANYWTRSMRYGYRTNTSDTGKTRFLAASGSQIYNSTSNYAVRPILAFSPQITIAVRGINRSELYINADITSINTVDIIGDFLTGTMLIDRTITEFIDDVITTVGTGAFAFCNELNKVELPFVEMISSLAFYNCYGLESIAIGTDLDTVCELENADAFYNTSQDLKIYVPDDLVDSYKEATNWTEHAAKIAGISERPR